ncbi:MAG: anti-sigma factor domain-containing protein [Stellaceae bacterium]
MIPALAARWDNARLWRRLAAVLAVLVSALFVAALVARPAPDFSALRVVAVVMDAAQRPAWAIRLAPAAHQIAADAWHPQPAPAGRAYQLWLAGAGKAPHPLGLLPQAGRKVIPVTPENARLMAGAGELLVTLEPVGGSPRQGPTGPVEFRGAFNDS